MTPASFDAKATGDQSKFVLVRDALPNYPSFENELYSSLDFNMVVMNFLWWFLFEHYTNNAVLAIGFVFVMERSLK
jgi:hypothetical protein